MGDNFIIPKYPHDMAMKMEEIFSLTLSCSSPPPFALFNLTAFGRLVGFESGSGGYSVFQQRNKPVGSIYVSFFFNFKAIYKSCFEIIFGFGFALQR
jgi:hypothetical protein